MARHNYVDIHGVVVRVPRHRVNSNSVEEAAICVKTIMGPRDIKEASSGYQKTCVEFSVISYEKETVEVMKKLEIGDVVEVIGFIATKSIERKSVCPTCGEVNYKGDDSSRAGGTRVYIYPKAIKIEERFGGCDLTLKEDENGNIEDCPCLANGCTDKDCKLLLANSKTWENAAFTYLHKYGEFANKVFLMGNLTSNPIEGTLEGGKRRYTRYQIAINRKYCPKGLAEICDRTDYPWIYSYGDKAVRDFENLRKGSIIYVDGALQSRKYTEQVECKGCGEVYDKKGTTLEVLSYDTEYIRNYGDDDNLKDGAEEDIFS